MENRPTREAALARMAEIEKELAKLESESFTSEQDDQRRIAMATASALDEIERLKRDAWRRAIAGTTSPLEYYMHCRRMDMALLAQTTGFSRWRIRWHFRPAVYAHVSDGVLLRYAEALGIDAATLKILVEQP